MNYTISIITKPYIKRFLINTYGNPANVCSSPILREKLNNSLIKPIRRHDKVYDKKLKGYTENIDVVISADQFYRYGWELSNTDMISFNKLAEQEIKLIMRNFVSTCLVLKMPVKDAIELFQEHYEFDDDDWNYQSIKKDFYRNGYHPKTNFNQILQNTINQTVKNIFLANVSLAGDRFAAHKNYQYENSI